MGKAPARCTRAHVRRHPFPNVGVCKHASKHDPMHSSVLMPPYVQMKGVAVYICLILSLVQSVHSAVAGRGAQTACHASISFPTHGTDGTYNLVGVKACMQLVKDDAVTLT